MEVWQRNWTVRAAIMDQDNKAAETNSSPLKNQLLLGLTRAEFAKAARWQTWTFVSQAAIVVVSSVPTLWKSDGVAYFAAAVAAGLAALSIWFNVLYQRSRFQAERGRRASLLLEGLGQTINNNEMRELRAGFSATDTEAAKYVEPDYYDASAPSGEKRLAEMLHQSAFWSKNLLSASANQTWLLVLFTFGISLFLVVTAVPLVSSESLAAFVQLFLALLTLLVSKDMLGAALAYSGSSAAVANVLPRLDVIRRHRYSRADLLLVFADYNAAVEAAPMFAPFVYKKHKERLNKLWKDEAWD